MKYLPSPRFVVCWLVGSLFLISTFLLGKLNANLVYSDILLPLLLLTLIFVVKQNLEKDLLLPIVLLLTYALISAIVHLYFNKLEIFFSFVIFARSAGVFIVMLFFSSVARKYGEKFLWVLLLIVLIAVQNTIMQYMSGVRAYYGYARIGANFAPANTGFLIGLLAVSLCGLTILLVKQKFLWIRRFIGLSALFSVVLILMTGSKSSISGTLVGLVLLGLYRVSKGEVSARFATLLSVVFLCIAGLIVFSFLTSKGLVYQSFERFNRIDSAAVNRIEKWVYFFFNTAHDFSNPIVFLFTGVGIGAAANFQYQQGSSFFNFDSVLLRMFWEWGPIGVILWLGIFTFILATTYKRSQTAGVCMFAIYLFGIVYGFGVEFLWIAPSGYAFAALIGVLHGSSYSMSTSLGITK
ncbi:MAG: hypothetical protein WCR08_06630 [Gammaproteobacteria bacterium]